MVNVAYILMIFQDFLFTLIAFLALVYSCLILFIRRFRHYNNIFILNICMSLIAFSIYYIVYATMSLLNPVEFFAPRTCNVIFYIYNFCSITTPFSFVTFTIHRFCSLLYHTRPFFRTKWWIIVSIASQRLIEVLICLPFMLAKQSGCANQPWMRFYTFIMAVFVSLFINTIFNVLILKYVRASVRRVHPQMASNNTTSDTNQRAKINHREISLIKQMILLFFLLIGGWTPVYILLIIGNYITIESLILRSSTLIDEMAVLGIVINFYLYNHEMKEYIINKIRQCIR